MVTVVPADKGWGEAFQSLGSGVGQGIQNEFESRADQKAIQNSLAKLGDNPEPKAVIEAITNTRTYNNKAKEKIIENVLGREKIDEAKRHAMKLESIAEKKNSIAEAKNNILSGKQTTDKSVQNREAVRNVVSQLDIPEEQKQILGDSLDLKDASGLLKTQFANKGKQTPFEKRMSEHNADEYIALSKEIPKVDANLENINYARKLSKDLGVSGTVKSAIGASKIGNELDAIGFTLMEPIIKIFNPSGPLAQKKLENLKDIYSIKSTDVPWKRDAKLDALERFGKQAKARALEKKALIEKYEGNPPRDVLDKFDKENEGMIDAMLDYDLVGKEVNIEGMPDPVKSKDRTVRNKKDGNTYYSDGVRWIKK